MKPQKTKNHKHLLAVMLLLCMLWGCTHGRVGAPTHETVSDATPAADNALQGDTAASAEEPDPFFTDEAEDDFFADEEGPPVIEPVRLVADPLAPFNRVMFTINDRLYFWCLKPIARGYRAVTPLFFRTGVKNAFHNIAMPVRFVSSVLQGKIKGAGTELSRFLVNTTVGVAGLWDPADKYLGLKPYEEDLGQTLGSYGIGNGFYIVWPFLGPSTVRDTVGMAGDMFLHPLYYVEPNELVYGLGALELVNKTSFRIGAYESVKAASLDPYVMIRDFYIEHRKKKIAE